jgi:hypothetical protein
VSTARHLLKDIDRLPYGPRQRMLATRARSLSRESLRALLDELHEHSTFARTVALHLAIAARDTEYVQRCLGAAEPAVVGRAIGAAVRLGVPPAAFVALLPTLPTALRRTLYQVVRRRRVTALAEALLPEAGARFGDHEAAALLPVCGAATVTARLPELGYAISSWALLGHLHPTVLLDHLDAELTRAPRRTWAGIVERTGSGIAAAALAEPARVLALLARVTPHAPLPTQLGRTIGWLARHDAAGLLAVLLDPRAAGHVPGGRSLWRALLDASDTELVGLGRALGSGRFARFLRVVPPARRAAVYAGVVGTGDEVHLDAVDELPAAARHAEARRLLALRRVDGYAPLRLQVTARLSWAEAKETLLTATRRSTADDRAAGYEALIRAGAISRDPAVFGEMLDGLGRLRNDQDPVRLAALRALGTAPPWLFPASHVDTVRTLVGEALRARDRSWHTQGQVRLLANRLIREGAVTERAELVDTGLHALAELSDNAAFLNLHGLDRELPRGAEHRVFAALKPRIDYEAGLGQYRMALSLATGLGRRAWRMPELQRLVGEARRAKEDTTVRTAIGLWLAPPSTHDERVAEVFHADRSTITVDAVWRGIAWRRTDLLDEVFGKPLHGRFLKRGVRFLPPFFGCFHRWLPRQCATYADLLENLATEPKATVWQQADAVGRLGALPGTADRLRAYLSSEHVPVVEAALTALAWTDDPAAVLGELLSYADTDRARVAVYAATRCARFVRPDRLGALLTPVLDARKVTSRKEAARLLAAHHVPDAPATLTAAWDAPNQHRDVACAIVSASQWFLDDERAWALLSRAVAGEHAPSPGSPDEVAAAVVRLVPTTIAERHRPRYAALVNQVASAADPETARLGLDALGEWSRWDAAGTDLMVDRLTDLTDTATWRPTMYALVTRCDVLADPTALLTAARRLRDATATDADLAGADRDLPARQRIAAIAEAVHATDTAALRDTARQLADLLAEVPEFRRHAVELAAFAVDLAAPDADLPGLRDLAALANRPIWAWHAHHALHSVLSGQVSRLAQDRLRTLAETLAAEDPAPAAPLLAVAIAGVAAPEAGWPPAWRDLVRGLRAHADADVRLAALDTFTSAE